MAAIGRFTGPYPMPKGAGGRVPPVTGGTLSPSSAAPKPRGFTIPAFPRGGFRDRLNAKLMNKLGKDLATGYGAAYYGMYRALSNTNPYKTVGWSRTADAFLNNFDLAAYFDMGPSGFEDTNDGGEWSKQNVGSPGWIPHGWTVCAGPDCDPPGTKMWGYVAASFSCPFTPGSCPPGQAWPVTEDAVNPRPYPERPDEWFSNAAPHILMVGVRTSGPPNRYTLIKSFTRMGWTSPPAEMPEYKLGTLTLPQEDFWPQADAALQERTMTYGRNQVGFGLKPYQVGVHQTVLTSGGTGSTGGGVHNITPPPKGTKEHKFDYSTGPLGDAYGFLTEVKDVADCIDGATKAWRRTNDHKGHASNHRKKLISPCHKMPLAQKIKCLVDNANRGNTDWAAAVKCIMLNNLEDEAIGRASRAASRGLNSYAHQLGDPSPHYGLGGFARRMR